MAGGAGVVTIFDEGGDDTIQFSSTLTRQQLVVRDTDGWIEIGINPANLANVTPSELLSSVLISPMEDGTRSVEYVSVGGSTYSLSDILAGSNHRPYLVTGPEFHSGSSAGQPLGVVHGYDIDSSTLQYSVVAVTGWGHSHSWTIWNGQLYSSAPMPSYATVSNITIRVSDGRLFSEQKAMVHWSAQGEYVSHSPVYDPGFDRMAASTFAAEDTLRANEATSSIWSTGLDDLSGHHAVI